MAELHIGDHAVSRGERPALIMSDGSPGLTYAELNARSDALAGQLAAAGVRPGEHVALLFGNQPEFLIAVWGANRMGLYYTPINWHLHADEVAFIIRDSEARVVMTAEAHRATVEAALADSGPDSGAGTEVAIWTSGQGGPSGFAPVGKAPLVPAAYEPLDGSAMVYSSGTSGKPKGIKRPPSGAAFGGYHGGDILMRDVFGGAQDTVFLCPAPLYHTAPLNYCMSIQKFGGTVVLMPSFDAAAMLEAVEKHRVTSMWIVPTMMGRLLKLPEELRAAKTPQHLTHVIHSAAPCPVEVKQAMMAWWGPVLYEFYAATEGNGIVIITPQEWLAHPGSVGKSADVRIVREDGSLADVGETGTIYFASAWSTFEYHNDPAKTAEASNAQGWTTLGDMGLLDEDGYLFLTDRKSHMIISGGVNIYPQEAENILSCHPAVQDVAVIGVPNADFGEEVKAVVELIPGQQPSPALAEELMEYCRSKLAHYKCPRSVDFTDVLPRMPTGKLMKRALRAQYWPDSAKMI